MSTHAPYLRFTARLIVLALLAGYAVVQAAVPARASTTLTVTTTTDELTADGDCSLREAIQSANTDTDVDDCSTGGFGTSLTGPYLIVFNTTTGIYRLTMHGIDDSNSAGDLDANADITVTGGGVGRTIIDGDGTPGTCATTVATDRVFDVGGSLRLERLTVRHGAVVDNTAIPSEQGGGIRNSGDLSLDNVAVTDNVVCDTHGDSAMGGGISNGGSLDLFESTVDRNRVDALNGGGAYGGGIESAFGGTLHVEASTISNNTAAGLNPSGGGLHVKGSGGGDIVNSTISGNHATTGGGLFWNGDTGAVFVVDHVTMNNNGVSIASLATGPMDIGRSALGDECDLEQADDVSSQNNNVAVDAASCHLNLSNDDDNNDLRLGPLAHNGGPTMTHLPAPNSPLVDHIKHFACGPNEDQRGEDRPDTVAGDCDAGSVELTAAERVPVTPASLDVTPETAENQLPGDLSHTLTASYDESALGSGDSNEIDFKILSGPNAKGGSNADFGCSLSNDTCTATYTSNGVSGTDLICAWNDLDSDDTYDPGGSAQDGGACDSEGLSGGTEDDLTDLVDKDWIAPAEPECGDGDDNDGDGDVDYPADLGCSSPTDDTEGTEGPHLPQCNDGDDNDGDGDVDFPNDLGCTALTDDTEDSEGPHTTRCNDGKDNDGDSRIDFPADRGCSSANDDSEARPTIRVRSRVSIEFNPLRNSYKGVVTSKRAECGRDRIVRLFHVDPGRDTSTGVDVTNRQGFWRIHLSDPAGAHYAKAKERVFRTSGGTRVVCLAAA
ncbi:MAG TPA: choice-of-anchor Q domain-containing protein, partial [Actinomycetota bacterium]|nr:choice-of-anchor Q domain-containing protein [Actinomycetota bacterium]